MYATSNGCRPGFCQAFPRGFQDTTSRGKQQSDDKPEKAQKFGGKVLTKKNKVIRAKTWKNASRNLQMKRKNISPNLEFLEIIFWFFNQPDKVFRVFFSEVEQC